MPEGTYQLTDSLVIADHRIVRGDGARKTIIKGVDGKRVFAVGEGESLGVSGVTITGGRIAYGTGGAIQGGGSAVAVADSTLTGNTAAGGGAISAMFGQLSIVRSTITGNRAVLDPDATDQANGTGGGVLVQLANLYIANSTFSANVAERAGGGLSALGTGHIVNTTITENTAPAKAGVDFVDFGGNNPDGGNDAVSSLIDVRATIVANNSGTSNCNAVQVRSSYSIGGDASCRFVGEGDRQISNPGLGELRDNGGPTDTHLPLDGSPAIDAAGLACATSDQRGLVQRRVRRPVRRRRGRARHGVRPRRAAGHRTVRRQRALVHRQWHGRGRHDDRRQGGERAPRHGADRGDRPVVGSRHADRRRSVDAVGDRPQRGVEPRPR